MSGWWILHSGNYKTNKDIREAFFPPFSKFLLLKCTLSFIKNTMVQVSILEGERDFVTTFVVNNTSICISWCSFLVHAT